jgi:amidase
VKMTGASLLLVSHWRYKELMPVRKAGAILLTKTNVAHTLMISETINHLWGRILNPHNRALTTGASSGGEGALIAFHGSPFGFGTDIGGSIRVTAAYD